VHSRINRAARRRNAAFDAVIDGPPRLLRTLGWSARDAVAFVVAAVAAAAILANALFMQPDAHPAPMFKAAPAPVQPFAAARSVPPAPAPPSAPERRTEPVPTPPPARAAAPVPVPSPARTPGEIINDIQRELARRGYYDGSVDGLYGPRTDSAIRDFEHAAGLKPSPEPNEALLQTIMRSPPRSARATTTSSVRPSAPARSEPAVERPAPSRRVIALQRALAEFGYGQIKPTGIVDAGTQAAIERFERERRLPVTGQPSERLARELTALTGRPLE
jgi:peptidoglycan hydrolase-like protein with peptidoglycan-binding domain